MGVSVEGLTKLFGTQKAVDNLSFNVGDREILGFLGPNGAGKSTTMKMLTGYLEPDEGTALIAGKDIREQTLACRRHIGYLPEHNPLYKDMYIREYLEWVARFYDVPNRKARVQEMIERIGLTREQHKQIGQLSKGYRQRVGLAQAMLHDPEVLILDEPTSGLDPNQLIEIRQLIKNLGKDKTIILSTHIMQEVAALCDRVVIIHQGRIVADGPVHTLEQQLGSAAQIVVGTETRIDKKVFTTIPGVRKVLEEDGGKRYRLIVDGNKDLGAAIFRLAVKQGWVLTELRQEQRGVEEVFQELTRGNVS
jgi:ABC-2 type transport system ATP-binding protein